MKNLLTWLIVGLLVLFLLKPEWDKKKKSKNAQNAKACVQNLPVAINLANQNLQDLQNLQNEYELEEEDEEEENVEEVEVSGEVCVEPGRSIVEEDIVDWIYADPARCALACLERDDCDVACTGRFNHCFFGRKGARTEEAEGQMVFSSQA